MLETPWHPALLIVGVRSGVYDSDNVTGADNQQERLDSYIAGDVDGEGFSVSVQRNSTCSVGFQLIPEFHVSQNGDRAQVLELIRQRLGCGYIKPNSRRDRALVFVVRKRRDLLEHVLPFFERNPMLSTKRTDFEKFAFVVREIALGHHRTPAGFRRLLDVALSMNGGGRHRRVRWTELLATPESSETARQTGPVKAWKIQSELHGDMQSQAEMTWPPSWRSGVTTLSVPIHHGRWSFERSRL
jgi:hypothetical protein